MDQRINEAVSQFRDAAIAKGDMVELAAQDRRLHDNMATAWRTLVECGAVGESAMKSLLTDDSKYVRLWAATQLLATGDDSALQIVEIEASSGGISGFNAQTVLDQWRDGTLTPPFEVS